jgi:hypothetical protein
MTGGIQKKVRADLNLFTDSAGKIFTTIEPLIIPSTVRQMRAFWYNAEASRVSQSE